MGVHVGATWQIRLNDRAAMSGSATRSSDAACSQITSLNVRHIMDFQPSRCFATPVTSKRQLRWASNIALRPICINLCVSIRSLETTILVEKALAV